MKRKSWFTIGATVLVIGAYAVLFVKVSPERSRANPPERRCLPNAVRIVWSDPADGFIDVRQIEDANQNPDGITQIRVRFSESVTLTGDCIDVLTTGGDTPAVQSVTQSGDDWIIDLDGPIPGAESTAIVFDAGAASVLVHSHPGDVNLDGTTDDDDTTALNAAIQAGSTDLKRYDINRDGAVGSADADRLDDILAVYNRTVWDPSPQPRLYCCCAWGDCTVYIGSGCTDNDPEVACPCIPDSCAAQP